MTLSKIEAVQWNINIAGDAVWPVWGSLRLTPMTASHGRGSPPVPTYQEGHGSLTITDVAEVQRLLWHHVYKYMCTDNPPDPHDWSYHPAVDDIRNHISEWNRHWSYLSLTRRMLSKGLHSRKKFLQSHSISFVLIEMQASMRMAMVIKMAIVKMA